MIDNFEQIKGLLEFDNADVFYFLQILKRKKEHPELGSNSYVVKTYFIKRLEELDFYRGEIEVLCNYHNARAYINLNKRSFERTAFHNLKKVTDIIMNKDFKAARKAYASVCGEYAADTDKKWIIDLDQEQMDDIEFMDLIGGVANEISHIEPNISEHKVIAQIQTKNGVHLISRPFNLQKFKEIFPSIDVHKQNPTLLYVP